MGNQTSQRPLSQRQLRVGELVKQNLGELFIRNEAKKEIHPRMIRAVRNRVPILQSTVLTMAIPPLSLPVTLRL